MVSVNEFFGNKRPEDGKYEFSYGFASSTHFDSANITALYLINWTLNARLDWLVVDIREARVSFLL